MVTDAQSGISIVTPQAFDLGTSQTPGSVRLAVISACQGIACPMWGSVLVVAPGATTGIHHHGEQDAIAYVLAGTCVVRWGERGEFATTTQAGDFLRVPGVASAHGDQPILDQIAPPDRRKKHAHPDRSQSA